MKWNIFVNTCLHFEITAKGKVSVWYTASTRLHVVRTCSLHPALWSVLHGHFVGLLVLLSLKVCVSAWCVAINISVFTWECQCVYSPKSSTCLSLLSSAISRGTDSWQELTLEQNGDSWVTALLCCRILSTSLSGDTRGTRSCVCVSDDGLAVIRGRIVKPGEMSVFPIEARQRWRGGSWAHVDCRPELFYTLPGGGKCENPIVQCDWV